MAELEHALLLARAMRFPDYPVPRPMTYEEIKANLVEGGVRHGHPQKVARGWFYNAYIGSHTSYGGRVTYGCSDGIHHSTEGDTTTTQDCGRMYRTKADAVMALRHDLTTQCAEILAKVDRLLADEAAK